MTYYQPEPASSARPSIQFTGDGKPLFWLMLRSLLLTIVTLGIYRFWMRTRLRQYYWSSIQVDGTPMEYTGTGLEKFLGFLIAVVMVAIYLVIVNALLFVFTLSVFDGNPLAPILSAVALLPLIYFAQYRGRRYIMSRTRLRGIRFSLEPGAGRFVLFALKHTLITVLTLGVLYPRMEWKLDQYLTQRTRFGDTPLDMHSHWRSLMKPYLVVIGPIILTVGIIALGISTEAPAAFLLIIPLYLALPFLLAHYYVASVRLRTAAKSVGVMTLSNTSRTGTIIGIWVLGFVLIAVITGILSTVMSMIVAFFATEGVAIDMATFTDDPSALITSQIVFLLGLAAIYVVSVLAYLIGYQVFIHRPSIAHFVDRSALDDVEKLDDVVQSQRDDIKDADGFADALDIGAAF